MVQDPKMPPSRRLLTELILLSIDNQDSPLGERFLKMAEKLAGGKGGYNDIDAPQEVETDDMSGALKSVLESIETKEKADEVS